MKKYHELAISVGNPANYGNPNSREEKKKVERPDVHRSAVQAGGPIKNTFSVLEE